MEKILTIRFFFSFVIQLNNYSILLAFLLSIFFFQNKHGNRDRNMILGIFFISYAVTIISYYIQGYELQHLAYFLAIVGNQFELFIVPLFFLYLKSFIDLKFQFRRKDFIHSFQQPCSMPPWQVTGLSPGWAGERFRA